MQYVNKNHFNEILEEVQYDLKNPREELEIEKNYTADLQYA